MRQRPVEVLNPATAFCARALCNLLVLVPQHDLRRIRTVTELKAEFLRERGICSLQGSFRRRNLLLRVGALPAAVEFSFDVTEDEKGPPRHDGDITTSQKRLRGWLRLWVGADLRH